MSSNRRQLTAVVTYDGGEESLSDAVVAAVAAASGSDPVPGPDGDGATLPPLYAAVDPDALDRLFDDPTGGSGAVDGEVRFTYNGYRVTARSDGEVIVERPGGRDDLDRDPLDDGT